MSVISYHTTPYHIPYHTPYNTIPYHTTPHHTIPYHTMPYHTTPHHTIPQHVIPYHTIPYHTIPHHKSPRPLRCIQPLTWDSSLPLSWCNEFLSVLEIFLGNPDIHTERNNENPIPITLPNHQFPIHRVSFDVIVVFAPPTSTNMERNTPPRRNPQVEP